MYFDQLRHYKQLIKVYSQIEEEQLQYLSFYQHTIELAKANHNIQLFREANQLLAQTQYMYNSIKRSKLIVQDEIKYFIS